MNGGWIGEDMRGECHDFCQSNILVMRLERTRHDKAQPEQVVNRPRCELHASGIHIWSDTVTCCSINDKYGRDEKCIQYFGWKIWREETLGRPRCKWEDNIRMDLREVGREVVDWMHLIQRTDEWRVVVNIVMNLRVPYKRRWVSWAAEWLLASQEDET